MFELYEFLYVQIMILESVKLNRSLKSEFFKATRRSGHWAESRYFQLPVCIQSGTGLGPESWPYQYNLVLKLRVYNYFIFRDDSE